MNYRISEKHIVPVGTPGKPAKYPFSKLKVGQSFSVSEDEKLSARRAAHQFGQRHGQRFITRGTRIWRTA